MASQPLPRPAHLTPSELGTKEYTTAVVSLDQTWLTCKNRSWDRLYTSEIENHTHDTADVGTIWFDDCNAEDKLVTFLHDPKLGLHSATTSFLDLGTGNGHLLFRLREVEEDDEEDDGDGDEEHDGHNVTVTAPSRGSRPFSGRMLGVDYSAQSIQFAQRIAESGGEADPSAIEFRHWDLMTEAPVPAVLNGANASGWDVVLDKGTFDAISLSEEQDAQGRRMCEGYRERVVPLVKPGGLFVITSCNWTEEEIKGWFVGEGLVFAAAVAYKSFTFGGKKGQSICSVCFRRSDP